MTFVKIQKNNTYSKRFQVKFRRRRQGKTDYYQRKRLIIQRKNKYNAPKWRFVVRRTNQKIICQVVWSTILGDRVKAAADSFELRRFGLTAGLSNYAAAYCTGLLTARRLLTQLTEETKGKHEGGDLAKTFNLVPETTGEYVNIEKLAEKKGIETRPFKCYLDLGLARATVGNRVFAAMKGAVDGGIHIPHSDKIFPKVKEATTKGGKDAKPAGDKKDAAKGGNPLRDRLFGLHVQTYMDKLKKSDTEYKAQFSQWDKCLTANKVKNLEELYKNVHAAIRKNPAKVTKPKKKVTHTRDAKNKGIVTSNGKTYRRDYRLTNKERKQRVQDKIAKYVKERAAKR
jgi:large subunit ribosomal protein L5e